MAVSVVLKWRGEEVALSCSPDVTYQQLAELIFDKTQVPAERQIVLAPGIKLNKQVLNLQKDKQVKDASGGKFVDGAKIKGTLVGTPVGAEFQAGVVAEVTQVAGSIVAVELPKGYINIGNTCYLGSVLALLEACDNFRDFLIAIPLTAIPQGADSIPGSIIETWKRRFQSPPKSLTEAPRPTPIFKAICTAHPDFAERAPGSFHPRMQDAEECLSRLFQSMTNLRDSSNRSITDFFNIEFEEETAVNPSVLESLGNPEVPSTRTTASAMKLSCYMGTPQKAVNFLLGGIELALEDEIEKQVESLGQSVLCHRKRKLTHLPEYLIVHMVRFEWKKANALAGSKAGRAKILKRVEYPNTLDLYSVCSDSLQDHLRVGRLAEQALRDRELEAKAKSGDEMPVEVEKPESIPCSGKYNLKAIVTHTGRSAVEGHYICWLWKEKDNQWIKLDDDKTSVIDSDKINLQGGIADGPCPYILLYERLNQVSDKTAAKPVADSAGDPPSKNRRLD